jgi:hypothetical protein
VTIAQTSPGLAARELVHRLGGHLREHLGLDPGVDAPREIRLVAAGHPLDEPPRHGLGVEPAEGVAEHPPGDLREVAAAGHALAVLPAGVEPGGVDADEGPVEVEEAGAVQRPSR